jgi:hypothetical protein
MVSSQAIPSNRRDELLRQFGEMATRRPLPYSEIAAIRTMIREELGPEVLIEAAGVIGFFECISKFVDATGRKASPSILYSILTFVLCTQTMIVHYLFSKKE